MDTPMVSNNAEARKRLSRASAEPHTAQPQEITGMPCEVPVPKNVNCTIFLIKN
jgi:hypothetical protein